MTNEIVTLQKKSDLLKSEVTVDVQAAKKIFDLVDSVKGKGVVFTVRGGGCSGYIYDLDVIEFDQDPPEHSEHFTVESGYFTNSVCPSSENIDQYPKYLHVYVPYQVIPIVKGTEIWYDSKLVGGGIKFRNPNAKRTCGCGESFS